MNIDNIKEACLEIAYDNEVFMKAETIEAFVFGFGAGVVCTCFLCLILSVFGILN